MTKKDYIKFAAAFAGTKPGFHYDIETTEELMRIWCESVNAIVHVLQEDNPRFDRARFLKACGEEISS